MDLNKISNSIKYGIPHSKFIDKILELRNPNIDIEYFTIYKKVKILHNNYDKIALPKSNFAIKFSKIYQNMFTNCTTLNNPNVVINKIESEYIIPIFSYKDYVYYVTETYTTYLIEKFETESYLKYPENFIKETSKIDVFQNTSITVEDFEKLLFYELCSNKDLIRYFVEK